MNRNIVEKSYTFCGYRVISNNGTGTLSWTDNLSNLSFVPDEVILRGISTLNFAGGNDNFINILWSDIAQPNGILLPLQFVTNNNTQLEVHFYIGRPVHNINFRLYSLNGSNQLVTPSNLITGNYVSLGYILEFVCYKKI